MVLSVAYVCGFLFLKRKAVIAPSIYSGGGEITMKLFSLSHLGVKHSYYHCFSVFRSLDNLVLA